MNRTFRQIAAVAACLAAVASTPGASASSRLSIQSAERVTWKFIRIDITEFSDYYPKYTMASMPDCKRVSRLVANCAYEVYERRDTGGPASPKSCDRIVNVRLKEGSTKPTGTMRSLGCHRT